MNPLPESDRSKLFPSGLTLDQNRDDGSVLTEIAPSVSFRFITADSTRRPFSQAESIVLR